MLNATKPGLVYTNPVSMPRPAQRNVDPATNAIKGNSFCGQSDGRQGRGANVFLPFGGGGAGPHNISEYVAAVNNLELPTPAQQARTDTCTAAAQGLVSGKEIFISTEAVLPEHERTVHVKQNGFECVDESRQAISALSE